MPELLQEHVAPSEMGGALLDLLEGGEGDKALIEAFEGIHERLARNADARAAEAVLDLCGVRSGVQQS